MEFFRALPALREELEDLDQRVRGRMATVVEVAPTGMVTVSLPGGEGTIGPYPTTSPWVSIGATGMLLPIRGGQHLFMATGSHAFSPVIPIGASVNAQQSTTSIATTENVFTLPYTAAAGAWAVSLHGAASMSRSSQSGQVVIEVAVNGVAQQQIASYSTAGQIAMTVPWAGVATVPEGGSLEVKLGFRGAGSAATTSAQGVAIQGLAIRVG